MSATFADLPKLTLTRHILEETLRLYPPAWMLTRTTTEDTDLGEYHIPCGTIIAYSPYIIHHRKDLHPDPERFDPDRWDEASPTRPTRITFLAFASGPRKCMGEQFAITNAVMTLATVAARWQVESVAGSDTRPTVSVGLRPRRLRVRMKARPD